MNHGSQLKRVLIRVAIVIAILFPIALVYAGVKVYNGIDDAYAQWGAVDMVIDYMRDHNSQWPPDWHSLKPYFDQSNGRVGGWSYEQFQSRIFIDFGADANQLRRLSRDSDNVPFDVIHATSFWGAQMGDGPNATLHYYFRRKSGIIEAPPPSGGWPSQTHRQVADAWYQRGLNVHFDAYGNVVAAWTGMADISRPDDSDVADLKGLATLKQLNLVGSNVTDAGLDVIKQLPELQRLDLGSEQITDAGLEHLVGHPSLRSLDFFGTQISDAGLQRLSEIPMLSEIRFDKRRISQPAVDKLKRAMPNLKVRREGELQAPVR